MRRGLSGPFACCVCRGQEPQSGIRTNLSGSILRMPSYGYSQQGAERTSIANHLEPRARVEHVETKDLPVDEAFWGFDADEAVRSALPISSVADMAIDGLSDAEGTAFRRALGFE